MVNVKLVFIGQSVNPTIISQELGVLQDKATINGTNNSTYKQWTFSQLATSEDDIESGAYEAWCKFLLEKSRPLERLKTLGYEGYLEFAFPSTDRVATRVKNDAYIDSPLVEILGRLGLGISFWFEQPSSTFVTSDNFKLVIPEPIVFYCQSDELMFYSGLRSISSVKSLQTEAGSPLVGTPNNIVLVLSSEIMDDDSLQQLIGIMFRYSLTMSSLQSQCTDMNRHWFKNTAAYWYQSVFGKDDN